METLRDADRKILLGGYTPTSERVADALVRKHERGVTVRVLLEGDPVGGERSARPTSSTALVAAGVEVRLVGGEHARYDYHHAKYAVVDDRAVVLTENWKPAGTGGNSSRGWGVVTDQPRIVDGLEATFRADAGWRRAALERLSAGAPVRARRAVRRRLSDTRRSQRGRRGTNRPAGHARQRPAATRSEYRRGRRLRRRRPGDPGRLGLPARQSPPAGPPAAASTSDFS